MRQKSRMRASETAMAGWSTNFWFEEVCKVFKMRCRDELQSERRDAEAVRHSLRQYRASLRACAHKNASLIY